MPMKITWVPFPYLWPELRCPIFATPFTSALLQAKVSEFDEIDGLPITEVPLKGHLKLGPFDIEFITLTHSIPEPNALAIRTPAGTLLHTGDWKIDPDPLIGQQTDSEQLTKIGDEGVLAIVCDSTNVFTPGRAGSEGDVRDNLMEVIQELKGRVVVTAFASNVARLQTIAQVAEKTDRHVALVGRSMFRMVGAARSAGYLDDIPPFIDAADAGYLPPDKVLYLCTGSQGEPRAALSRIASGTHPHVVLEEGDTVLFSSRVIPGNEKSIFALQNSLVELGVQVMTEKDHAIHVSGHPCRDELTQMYQWVKPQIAVPVHGELRHLVEHQALAQSLQVPETVVAPNGSMVEFSDGKARIVEEVQSGKLHLDGSVILDSMGPTLKERRQISFAGYVHIACAVNKKGNLLAEPRVHFRGIPDSEEGDLAYEVGEITEEVILGNRMNRRVDLNLEERVRRAVRQYISGQTGKKPVTVVDVIQV